MAKDSPQRFRATIYRKGPNPYVDVPQRVSSALSSRARAGRINAEGLLNDTSIRGERVEPQARWR